MKSMTGFGRSSNRSVAHVGARSAKAGKSAARAIGVELDVSLRSVNGRYLEIRFHLPREYAGLESELKALIAETFARGTIDLYINRERAPGSGAAEVKVNTELARQWLKSYRQLGKDLKLEAEPTLELLTRIPEVLHVEEHAEASDAEKKLVLQLVKQAVESCDKERQREGKALESELNSHCARLEDLAVRMEALKEEARSELERRFKDRLQKLGFEGKVDDQRLAQEIVIQLDRTDVSEELARLKEHLKAYRQLLKSPEPQGKKLDFYAQELLREVNTIGSKSHIAKLTGLVVEAKTLVEKIREQVQNAE